MKKKLLLLMLCAVTAIAAGCGKTPDYPVMDDVKEPANMDVGTVNGFTGSYDSDEWTLGDNVPEIFAIYDKDVYEAGNPENNCSNINVIIAGEYDGHLTEDDMEDLINEVKSTNMAGFNIKRNEMRLFMDEPVIYYEVESKLTDDMLDLMIQQGEITEAYISELGGREALKKMREASSIGMCTVIDKKIIMVTGAYRDGSEDIAEEIVEAMKLLIKTGKAA